MPLRAYQEELVSRVRKAWLKGKKAPCIVLPCGGGKSVIVAEIAKRTTEKHNHVLFLVHRRELCEQIENTFRKWGVDMLRCRVMMVQTAARRIDKMSAPSLIITDENHHSLASTYKKVYEAFPNAYRVGVTATPVRLDGSGLSDVNDELIIGVSAHWLIENNCLAPYDYYAPSLVDLTGIKIKKGDYDVSSVENLMLRKAVFGDVIKYYKQLAKGRQAVCYCTSVRHSMETAMQFNLAGIDAAHIDGSTPKAERERIIEDFRRGAIDILCNVDLISEGFDVPDCECAILLRPTQSLTLYIQQSMRCMRYRKGKRAVIIDHVGNYARFGMPDADREWTLESRKKQKRELEKSDEINIKQCPECCCVFSPKDENGAAVTVCPNCGYEFPKKQRSEIEQEQAELKKIDGFVLDFKTPDECHSYSELLDYAKSHGYKTGWAFYQAKERGMITSDGRA